MRAYMEPEMEIIRLESTDVIVTSGIGDVDEGDM